MVVFQAVKNKLNKFNTKGIMAESRLIRNSKPIVGLTDLAFIS